jgi:serine/threonine-protein kinase RsbW
LNSFCRAASNQSAQAVDAALRVAQNAGFGEEALSAIDLAVREAVSNAAVHGNKQDERKTVKIDFAPSKTRLVISVRDQGKDFDPAAVADPTDLQNLLKPSGRGILFMRAFMDEVEYLQHTEGGAVCE